MTSTPQTPKPHVGTVEVLPTVVHTQHGTFHFGRHYAEDVQDNAFRMAARTPVSSVDLSVSRHWIPGKMLDQGSTSSCVGHTGRAFLDAIPTRRTKGILLSAFDLYYGAQDNDEWEGRNYEGTSVRGLFKFMQKQGLLKGAYLWGKSVLEMAAHVIERGTIAWGGPWSYGMCFPDENGVITDDRRYLSGHAVLFTGRSPAKKKIGGKFGPWWRGRNSWGDWGPHGGKFWMHEDDLQRLFEDQHVEACSAIEK